MTELQNLFADLPSYAPEELFVTLASGPGVHIERIVSFGHTSPEGFWYDQAEDEWVLVVQGAAHLQYEDRTVSMQRGDWIHIPAHKKHRIAWTTPDEPTIWLAVHFGSGNRNS